MPLNWYVACDDQNSVNMKERVSQNVISEYEPLNRLFEEKDTRETVRNVSDSEMCAREVDQVDSDGFYRFLSVRDP